jgi:hypothetical protein
VAASGQLGLQGVEALVPFPAQFGEPALDALERLTVEGIESAGAFGAHASEAALPEHAQLARDSGLCRPELRLKGLNDVAGAELAAG